MENQASTDPIFLNDKHEDLPGDVEQTLVGCCVPFEKIDLDRAGIACFIRVFINGIEGVFMIDTGASLSIFNSASLERFELNLESQEISNIPLSGIEGTKNGVSFLTMRTFRIGDLLVENYSMCLVDLSHMTRHLADAIKQFDGVLGGDFLNRYRATIDYDSSVMHFIYSSNEPVIETQIGSTSNAPHVGSYFSDEDNYDLALQVFEKEEGRKPNMNDTRDMNAVATLETGIRHARNFQHP